MVNTRIFTRCEASLVRHGCSGHSDRVIHTNPSGPHDASQDALMIIFHQGAQSLADRIHLPARHPGFVHEKNRITDFDMSPDAGDEWDALRLDVGAHRAGKNHGQPERRRVRGDLLAFDQSDLAMVRPIGRRIDAAEIPRFANDSFVRGDLEGIHGRQGGAGFGRVQMKRRDATDGLRFHGLEFMTAATGNGKPRMAGKIRKTREF